MKATKDRIVVLPPVIDPFKQLKSGLFIEDEKYQPSVDIRASTEGTVIEVGPNVTQIKVGDKVRFEKFIGIGFEHEGTEFLSIREGDIQIVE